jgi:hypothetical protein
MLSYTPGEIIAHLIPSKNVNPEDYDDEITAIEGGRRNDNRI